MSVNVLYCTTAVATGGRDGEAATKDGSFQVKLATPKERWPQRAGQQSGAAVRRRLRLLHRAMKFVGAQDKTKVPADTKVTSTVGIGPRSEGGFGLDISLEISLPGLPRAEAEALVEKAHQVCPYSNATRNNVAVRLSVV
jgi:lipoyl-dependent peroxiredoxin